MATLNCKDTLDASNHNAEVDRLSLKMFYLQEIVKLAARASESTRVLQGIKDALSVEPEAKELLGTKVRAIHSWEDREDSAGEVLAYVAEELDDINSKFTWLAYNKARTVHG
ncbi:hypothetical protein WIT60_05765 [Aquabacterium sp. G14]|uniref:hypothetical protein n=1 Tax=Aquabacterium sp. G14 TaxID=3130164 RepID=UPI0030AC6CFF